MRYEWDLEKAKLNHKEHGIYFSDAVMVFLDEYAITIEDQSHQEQRFVTLGIDAFGRILVVVYTWRDNDVRIISARKATPKERKQYEGKR